MIEVSVRDDFLTDGVQFGIRRKYQGPETLYATSVNDFGTLVWEPLSQEQLMVIRRPVLALDGETARAVMDALARYFGGITDTQLIQQAYAKEQVRVDKMLDRILDLASRPQKIELRKAEQ